MAETIKTKDYRAHYKAKNTPRERKFKSRLVEFFSRTPVWQPVLFYNVLAGVILYFCFAEWGFPIGQSIALFFGGWLFMSLLEYSAHRWVFHMRITTKLRETVQYNAHGIHHEYPKDKDTLAMPLVLSIVLASVFMGLFYLIMGVRAFPFVSGIYVGYALYLGVHWLVHAMPPPNNIFRGLWNNHAVHHYKDDEVVFGVSSQLWDYIFGTMPKKDKSK